MIKREIHVPIIRLKARSALISHHNGESPGPQRQLGVLFGGLQLYQGPMGDNGPHRGRALPLLLLSPPPHPQWPACCMGPLENIGPCCVTTNTASVLTKDRSVGPTSLSLLFSVGVILFTAAQLHRPRWEKLVVEFCPCCPWVTWQILELLLPSSCFSSAFINV